MPKGESSVKRKRDNSTSSDEDRSKRKSHKKSKKKKQRHSSSSSSDSDKIKNKKYKLKEKKKHKKSKEKKRKNEKEKIKMVEKDNAELSVGPEVPIELLEKSKRMTPMTKEEWEKKQSVVKRVYDPETGRQRLIRGDGEVLEEIVSRDKHMQINKQASASDGNFFQAKLSNKFPQGSQDYF